MARGSTKIDESILERVRQHTKKNFLTVSGFINATLQKELDMIEKREALITPYQAGMSKYLMKKRTKRK